MCFWDWNVCEKINNSLRKYLIFKQATVKRFHCSDRNLFTFASYFVSLFLALAKESAIFKEILTAFLFKVPL